MDSGAEFPFSQTSQQPNTSTSNCYACSHMEIYDGQKSVISYTRTTSPPPSSWSTRVHLWRTRTWMFNGAKWSATLKKNAFVRRRCFFALMLIQYLLNGSQTMKIPPHTAIPLRRLFYLIARKKFKMAINFILTRLSACTLHGNWKGRQDCTSKKIL